MCENNEVFISQPLKSRLHYYEHDPPKALGNDTQNIVDLFFYYDLARFYVQVIDDSLQSKIFYYNITYPPCGKYLSDLQMNQRKALNLYERFSNKFFYGLFGQFMFNFNSKLNYQELSMRINRVMFKKDFHKQISKVAEWEFEGQLGQLYFTSLQEQASKPGIPMYQVVTVIVCQVSI